jgi:hypothetical protein
MKRILIAMALAAMMVFGTATASLAFDPPDHEDASGLVSNPSFPGIGGHAHVFENDHSSGAWEAVFHSAQIDL